MRQQNLPKNIKEPAGSKNANQLQIFLSCEKKINRKKKSITLLFVIKRSCFLICLFSRSPMILWKYFSVVIKQFTVNSGIFKIIHFLYCALNVFTYLNIMKSLMQSRPIFFIKCTHQYSSFFLLFYIGDSLCFSSTTTSYCS